MTDEHAVERRNNGQGMRRVTDHAAPVWRLIMTAIATAMIVSTAIAALLSEYWTLQLAHLDDQSALRHEAQSSHISSIQVAVETIEANLQDLRQHWIRSAEWMRSNERSINGNVATIAGIISRLDNVEASMLERTKDRFYRSDWEQAQDWLQVEIKRLDARVDKCFHKMDATEAEIRDR